MQSQSRAATRPAEYGRAAAIALPRQRAGRCGSCSALALAVHRDGRLPPSQRPTEIADTSHPTAPLAPSQTVVKNGPPLLAAVVCSTAAAFAPRGRRRRRRAGDPRRSPPRPCRRCRTCSSHQTRATSAATDLFPTFAPRGVSSKKHISSSWLLAAPPRFRGRRGQRSRRPSPEKAVGRCAPAGDVKRFNCACCASNRP